MRIVLDIGHPAHVHYFKNTIRKLKTNGHDVLIFARDREVIIDLLNNLNLSFINRGKGKNTKLGKLFYIFKTDIKILKESIKFKPDIFLSFTIPYPAHISFLLGKPHIALNDTEHVDKINSKITHPFCSSILTPQSYLNDLGSKQVKFNNVVEGLYLHKKYFKADIRIKKSLNLKPNEEYVVLRFVSWNAHHDYGQSGLNVETKRNLIELLKLKYKIFISSEDELPDEFKSYQLDISPEKMHDVLAFATLFIGESATMASESVLLGTKAVYINSLPLMGYLKLEQDAGLLKYFNTSKGVVDFVKNLIKDHNLKENAKEKSKILQKDFIDPTEFLIWFIENFPKSKIVLEKNPDYQYNFK